MKIGFSQTAVHSMRGAVGADFANRLQNAIRQHTDWNYSCTQTDDGWFLKPSFRNMPYRNSFVPEINIGISRDNGQTSLYMKGQPVKFVRIFMRFWFCCLLMMEGILLVIAATSGTESLFPVFIPVIMCIFGYLLCEIATKATFRTVLKAIEKEFP